MSDEFLTINEVPIIEISKLPVGVDVVRVYVRKGIRPPGVSLKTFLSESGAYAHLISEIENYDQTEAKVV